MKGWDDVGERRDKGVKIGDIDSLKEHVQFNTELLLKANAAFELYQGFLVQFNKDKDKHFPHLLVLIIDAFVTNCVLYTTRLIDKREHINICNTINYASLLLPHNKRILGIKSEIQNEQARIDRLCKRRDKQYAHSDIENLDDNISSLYPLLREDLHEILKLCFRAINSVHTEVNGYFIGGYNSSKGTYILRNTELALSEIEKINNIFKLHDKMFEFMRTNNQIELIELIYSKSDETGKEEPTA